MRLFRTAIGRWLMIAGLRVMPNGRAKAELTELFDKWTEKVRITLAVNAFMTRDDHP